MEVKIRVTLVLIPFVGERLAGLEAFRCHGQLDDDVLVDLGQVFAFLDHARCIQGDDLGRDRTVDDGYDFLDNVLEFAP